MFLNRGSAKLHIELFQWRGEDLSSKKDGGIIRRIIKSGEGFRMPNDGAMVDGRFKICGIEYFKSA
ncbi:hypothetical protein Avbf_07082 [Armadillidium vulgare]|nr:hypothetical protein Avbf_07082 [Armadillidium vulgare]